MIRVPVQSWYEDTYKKPFNYPQFFNGYEEIPIPVNSPYHAGDVVLINDGLDKPCIGVVLGVIDCDRGDLRTDARGMVSFDSIRLVKSMKELKSYPKVEDILASLEKIKANTKRRNANMRNFMKQFK
jgi:hypothetical protein